MERVIEFTHMEVFKEATITAFYLIERDRMGRERKSHECHATSYMVKLYITSISNLKNYL